MLLFLCVWDMRCQRLNTLLHTHSHTDSGVFSLPVGPLRAGLRVDAAVRLIEFSLASLRCLDSLTEKQRESCRLRVKAAKGGESRESLMSSQRVKADEGRDGCWLWWYVNVRVQTFEMNVNITPASSVRAVLITYNFLNELKATSHFERIWF